MLTVINNGKEMSVNVVRITVIHSENCTEYTVWFFFAAKTVTNIIFQIGNRIFRQMKRIGILCEY